MKKLVFSMPIIIVIIALLLNSGIEKINTNSTVELSFYYGDSKVKTNLNKEESDTIISILNGKRYENKMVTGELSCGFSSNASLKIESEIYQPACDGCNYVYVKSKDKYIYLKDSERDTINKIFEKHGGFFPCV